MIMKEKKDNSKMPMGRKNIVLLAVGFLIMVLGYILMTGGGSDNPEVFSYEMFDARRLVIAPLLILIGIVVEVVAIMKRPKNE